MVIHHDRIMSCAFSCGKSCLGKLQPKLLHDGGVFRSQITEGVHAADGLQLLHHTLSQPIAPAQQRLVVLLAVEKALGMIERQLTVDAAQQLYGGLQVGELLLHDDFFYLSWQQLAQMCEQRQNTFFIIIRADGGVDQQSDSHTHRGVAQSKQGIPKNVIRRGQTGGEKNDARERGGEGQLARIAQNDQQQYA